MIHSLLLSFQVISYYLLFKTLLSFLIKCESPAGAASSVSITTEDNAEKRLQFRSMTVHVICTGTCRMITAVQLEHILCCYRTYDSFQDLLLKNSYISDNYVVSDFQTEAE